MWYDLVLPLLVFIVFGLFVGYLFDYGREECESKEKAHEVYKKSRA